MDDPNKPKVIYVSRPNQQHMLHLFLPVKKNVLVTGPLVLKGIVNTFIDSLFPTVPSSFVIPPPVPDPGSGPDMRASTGVHFVFFYLLLAGQKPPLFGPSFQTDPNKDLLVIQAIYDDDFRPYIASFVQQPAVADGLNGVLSILDESNIDGIDANGPNSANYILEKGGVVRNPDAFNNLLENYNLTAPHNAIAVAGFVPSVDSNPSFAATFPGLTVRKILQYYPNAIEEWPFSPQPIVYFEK